VAIIKLPILLLRSQMKINDQLSKEANRWKINCSKKVKMSNLLQTKITEGQIITIQNFQTNSNLTRITAEIMDLRPTSRTD